MAREAIFIGYRRDDTADVAGRIFDALESRFGRDRIFKDVDNLRPGADFGEYIKTILPRCRVALILIGPNWVNAVDEDGRRRLDDPNDWVRIEIEIALAAGDLDVVPVLINGARMPRAEELPPSLHPLLRRHAATIRRDPDFRDDIDRLATTLRASLRTGFLDLGSLGGDRRPQPSSVQRASKATRTPFVTTALLGGLIAGILSALLFYLISVPEMGWQSVVRFCAFYLGGQWATEWANSEIGAALVYLGTHFATMTIVAGAFVLASSRLTALKERPILSALVFVLGLDVTVVALGWLLFGWALPWFPMRLWLPSLNPIFYVSESVPIWVWLALILHPISVGLPLALVARLRT
jgi:hypothetical protein